MIYYRHLFWRSVSVQADYTAPSPGHIEHTFCQSCLIGGIFRQFVYTIFASPAQLIHLTLPHISFIIFLSLNYHHSPFNSSQFTPSSPVHSLSLILPLALIILIYYYQPLASFLSPCLISIIFIISSLSPIHTLTHIFYLFRQYPPHTHPLLIILYNPHHIIIPINLLFTLTTCPIFYPPIPFLTYNIIYNTHA